jgi:hypothetical protein
VAIAWFLVEAAYEMTFKIATQAPLKVQAQRPDDLRSSNLEQLRFQFQDTPSDHAPE